MNNMHEEFPQGSPNREGRISMIDYGNFLHKYWASIQSKYLRIGQAFCNAFKIHDPELFYMEDREKAENIIRRYVLD